MEELDDEIIVEQKEEAKAENKTTTEKGNDNKMPFFKKLVKDYLSIGLSIIAIFILFLARFILACGGYDAYGAYNWFGLIGFGTALAGIVLELIKVVQKGKVELATFIPVFAVALMFVVNAYMPASPF